VRDSTNSCGCFQNPLRRSEFAPRPRWSAGRASSVGERGSRSGSAGFSLVGILVSMAIIVVLMAVLLGSLNTAVTGAGNTTSGSVRSIQDQIQLSETFKGFLVMGGAASSFPVPSRLDRSAKTSRDVTAALYAIPIMNNSMAPKMLVSANERNPVVEVDEEYDYSVYDPASGVFWDPGFKGDLETGSNVSFAHVLLIGSRFEKHWLGPSLDGRFPLLGTRGPRDGKVSGSSFTTGRNGEWAGHICFGDGHVAWVNSTDAPGLTVGSAGGTRADGLFSMEEGFEGGDAMLVFMRLVGDKREMQFD